MITAPLKIEATKMGICMEGNERAMCATLDLLCRRKKEVSYVELGIASGQTLAAMSQRISKASGVKEWMTTGFDIPGGWSLDEAAVKQLLPDVHWMVGSADGPIAASPKVNSANVMIASGRRVLHGHWRRGIDFAFVDACHGAPCVKGDFIAVAKHMRRGGIVAFHDASPQCQGLHPQPHCGTPIAVRQALKELGLLEDKLEGWRFLGETAVVHNVAFFQYVGFEPLFQTVAMPPESQEIRLVESGPGWTPAHEVKFLLWLAGQTSASGTGQGSILEIGCNGGQTTRELAAAFPQREVIGVDWSGAPTMTAGQRSEQPKQGEVGRLAAGRPNVTILDQNSAELDYRRLCECRVQSAESRVGAMNRIGLVFIDGDHSYAGVRTDTEKALEYFAAMPGKKKERRFIVWHDVSESHPNWVGVLDYLSKEVAPYYEVKRVKDTWLAYLEV